MLDRVNIRLGEKVNTPETPRAEPPVPVANDKSDYHEKIKLRHVKIADTYYPHNKPDSISFKDYGKQILTNKNDEVTISSMVDLAQSKGWNTLSIKGDDAFKKAVFLEASQRGLEVKGYKPTQDDLHLVEKTKRETKKAPEKELSPLNQKTKDFIKSVLSDAGYPKSEREKIQAKVVRKIELAWARNDIAGKKTMPKAPDAVDIKPIKPAPKISFN